MTPRLEKYLIDKFPDFFVDVTKSPRETCMCWGCSHGDGWFLLLHSLCWKIKGHIENHNKNVEWQEKWEKENKEKGEPIEERPEWAKERIKFKFEQIKEKFSELRIYHSGGDETINGYISFAEYLSNFTCENCGKSDFTIGKTTKGWIQTLCKECAVKKQSDIIEIEGWTPLEQNEEFEKLFKSLKENIEKV